MFFTFLNSINGTKLRNASCICINGWGKHSLTLRFFLNFSSRNVKFGAKAEQHNYVVSRNISDKKYKWHDLHRSTDVMIFYFSNTDFL